MGLCLGEAVGIPTVSTSRKVQYTPYSKDFRGTHAAVRSPTNIYRMAPLDFIDMQIR
jgi:hypothetical protein